MDLEINENALAANDTFTNSSGGVMMITPPIGEDFWLMRVKLSENQAVVCFPKFGLIGCGFQKEEDWNTNLPLSCSADEIFAHIRHNKGDDSIKDSDCVEAIKLLQTAVAEMK